MIVNENDRCAKWSEICGGRYGTNRLPARIVECDKIRNAIVDKWAKSMVRRQCEAEMLPRVFAHDANR